MKYQFMVILAVVLSIVMAGPVITQAQEAQQTPAETEKTEPQKINVNSAAQEELESLPGIGPKLAQEIIAGRPYQTVDDLLKVKGIGEKKLAQLKDLIEVKKIELNTATVNELMALPGIDQEIAEELVAECPFNNVEELLKILKSEEKLAAINDWIEVVPIPKEKCSADRGWKSSGTEPVQPAETETTTTTP